MESSTYVIRHVVTSFLFRQEEGKEFPTVLLLKRSNKVSSYKNHWSGISGGIQPGEVPFDAAIREIQEEVGLSHDQIELIRYAPPVRVNGVRACQFSTVAGNTDNSESFNFNFQHRNYFLVYPFLFIVNNLDGFRLNWENSDYTWLPAIAVIANKYLPKRLQGHFSEAMQNFCSSFHHEVSEKVGTDKLAGQKEGESCSFSFAQRTDNINFNSSLKDDVNLTPLFPTVPDLADVLAAVYVVSELTELIEELKNDKTHGATELTMFSFRALEKWLSKNLNQHQIGFINGKQLFESDNKLFFLLPPTAFSRWLGFSLYHLGKSRPAMAPLYNAFTHLRQQLKSYINNCSDLPAYLSTFAKNIYLLKEDALSDPDFRFGSRAHILERFCWGLEFSATMRSDSNNNTNTLVLYLTNICSNYMQLEAVNLENVIANVSSFLCNPLINTIVVHSYSSTLALSLVKTYIMRKKRKHGDKSSSCAAENEMLPALHVIATESRPLFEGRKLISKVLQDITGLSLNQEDIIPQIMRFTLITDAQIALAIQQADAVLCGADTLFDDGSFVNKTGSFLLAMASCNVLTSRRVPFYVCTQLNKLLSISHYSRYDVLFDVLQLDTVSAMLQSSSTSNNSNLGIHPAQEATKLFTLFNDINAPTGFLSESMDASEVLPDLETCNENFNHATTTSPLELNLRQQYKNGLLHVENVYFECVPSKYVTGYFTEHGLLRMQELFSFLQ